MGIMERFDQYAHEWETTDPDNWTWHQWAFAGAVAISLGSCIGLVIGLLWLTVRI